MSARGLILALSLCLSVILGSLGVGHAEEAGGPPPEAKKAFADGKAAFERGDYETALQMFQRAMLIAPAPSLYYNIGVAYERLARYEDSAIAFDSYLREVDAPTTDEDRTFQTNLRARAAANRERARNAPQTPPPRVAEAPPPPTASPRYPTYPVYSPPPVYTPPVLTHQQKLLEARRHRNNGIALLIVGGVFLGAGAGLTAWVVTTYNVSELNGGLSLWGVASLMVIGVPLFIPGAVALARWQRELSRELKRPDNGAAAAKAALDLVVPMTPTSNAPTLVLGTPPIRF